MINGRLKPPKQEVGKNFIAHPSSEEPYEALCPVFSLEHMSRHVKEHCLLTCDKNEKAAFANTLNKLSQLTWSEIRHGHRHGVGYEKITKIGVPIPKTITSDVSFIAFRFCGLKPMIGYREKNLFHIVWLDTKFKCYKHS